MVSAPDDPFISSLWQCAVKGAENHRLVLDDQHADHDAAAVASETPGVAGVSPGAADRGAAGRHPGRALPAGQRAAAIVVLGHRAGCGHHLTTAGPCTRLPPAGRTTFGNRLLAAPETARSPGTALVQRPVAQRPGPPPAGGGPHRYPEVTSDTVDAIEPILIPRLVVPETTRAELQAALLMNAGDHDLLDELQPLADHARGVGTPTMASKSTPGTGRRTSPASARGRRVARQRRSPAPVAGTASTPGRRRHRGDQGDAGSCDPNWGQPVSPPPPGSSRGARPPGPFEGCARRRDRPDAPGIGPTVKQHLAAIIRMLCDWLVVSEVLPVNPAAAVRGPKHVVTKGSTPVLSPGGSTEAPRLHRHGALWPGSGTRLSSR